MSYTPRLLSRDFARHVLNASHPGRRREPSQQKSRWPARWNGVRHTVMTEMGATPFNESFKSKHVAPACGQDGATDFDWNAVDGAVDTQSATEQGAERREIMARFVQWLASDGASALEIGRRVLAIEHIRNPQGTQRELARRMKMDEGDVSKKIQNLRAILANGIGAF